MNRFDQYQDVRLYCARGSELPQAKLDEQAVAAILRDYRPFCPVNGGKATAARYNVHYNTIVKLVRRETWAHVRAA